MNCISVYSYYTQNKPSDMEANIFNKQSCRANKWRSSSLEPGQGANNPSP